MGESKPEDAPEKSAQEQSSNDAQPGSSNRVVSNITDSLHPTSALITLIRRVGVSFISAGAVAQYRRRLILTAVQRCKRENVEKGVIGQCVKGTFSDYARSARCLGPPLLSIPLNAFTESLQMVIASSLSTDEKKVESGHCFDSPTHLFIHTSADMIAALLYAPLEVAGNRLFADDQMEQYSGSVFACMHESVREDGVLVLFRGLPLTLASIAVKNVVAYASFHALSFVEERVREWVAGVRGKETSERGWMCLLLLKVSARVVGIAVALPLTLAKSSLQCLAPDEYANTSSVSEVTHQTERCAHLVGSVLGRLTQRSGV